tara:strand:- start:301 stop:693 length:393 start_codon:yes stop_codon:yes gene_type:complete
MNNIEDFIKQLATEVKVMKEKLPVLSHLNDEIQKSDYFTSEEKTTTSQKLQKFQKDHDDKVEAFKSKLTVYENTTKKLQTVIDSRKKVIDSVLHKNQSINCDEFISIFNSRDASLKKELQLSLDKITDKK